VERDPSLHAFAGAIAFHTYHGVTTRDLEAWARSARRTNLPIMVTEGGPNSSAHRYPLGFLEPWFQLEEIDQYIRVCNIVQPLTIMQWQLTSDYSVLTGMGMYGVDGPLAPTQRFWNLKQLGTTPAGSFALPVACTAPTVSCAAFGSSLDDVYSIHLVNNGAAREVRLTGLPPRVQSLTTYVTDAARGMERMPPVPVVNGTAVFTIDAASYTSVFSLPAAAVSAQ